MKTTCLFLLTAVLLTACGRSEKATTTGKTTTSDSTGVPASATRSAGKIAKPQNCQSLAKADLLGKANVYQESAKPISVTITVDQDSTTQQTNGNCYFDNSVMVRATKKSGAPLFKRTFLKDDLLYFSKNDESIERSILKNVTYKPSFNAQKYLTITMQLVDPDSKKTADYVLFMNYFGEIVKVR